MSIYKIYTILLCALLALTKLSGQSHNNFQHLKPTYNGESIKPINSVQDHLGHIWFSYKSGLLIYDGYNYSHISIGEIFPIATQDDRINNISKDYHDNIWVLSNNGLIAKYNNNGQIEFLSSKIQAKITSIHMFSDSIFLVLKNGIILRYINDDFEKIVRIPEIDGIIKQIKDIEFFSSNDLYISTTDGNIMKYNISSKLLHEIKLPFSKYSGNLVLAKDYNKRLWIGTETSGLFVYDVINETFIQGSLFEANQFDIYHELFITIFCDSKGYIWAGTDGGGLYQVNLSNGAIEIFRHHPNNSFSLSSNTIMDVMEDSNGNIWIITNYGDLNIYSNRNSNINYHEGSGNRVPSRVLSIYKDSKDILWLGLDGTGLTKITTQANGNIEEKQYFNNINNGFYIQSIAEDDHGNFWFGTYKNGLWFYNSAKSEFKNIPIINSNNELVKDVRTVVKDFKNRIWVGSNNTLNIFSGENKQIAVFTNKMSKINNDMLQGMVEDKNGTIWLGYIYQGLIKLNENENNLQESTFTRYPNNENLLVENSYGIYDMTKDDNGIIWLVNSNKKLIKFNPENQTYHSFNKFEPLKDLDFQSILSTEKNKLWLGSTNGIWNLNLNDSITTSYHVKDGIQGNFLLGRSAFQDKNGLLYFGGENGLNFFDPQKINKQKSLVSFHIEAIEILNQPAKSIIPDQLTTGISNITALKLKNNQSSFSFKFSALDYILDSNFYYQYRLLGFNDKWIDTHKERVATYTNIPAGNYIFEVRAGSKRNNWDIGTKKIDINIESVIWNKPIAYLFYLLLFGLFIYFIRNWYSMKKNLLSEKISHQKERELSDLKMNFFTKMSHEIQTPITLILGPIGDMIKRAEQNGNLLLKQRLGIISNNVNRLSRIAFELTTARDKEIGQLSLMVTKNNLFEDLQNISLAFKEIARIKNIDFSINCPKNLIIVWYDKEKIEHVIYNLVSNAFKFTPKDGNIQLVVSPLNKKESIKISILDSGAGIPKEELKDIFKLFYQSELGKQKKGTGIGLALAKDILNLHHGKIKVNSSPTEGTNFTVILPISKNSYTDTERIMEDSEIPSAKDTPSHNEVQDQVDLLTNDIVKKTILIVEDSFELQVFLKDLLSPIYNILQAENGEEGLQYAKTRIPDLILSDIMMPVMDGIEMCNLLHKDPLTDHIPIVLITAKNSSNSKIQGLRSGAIEYINKPFDTNELILKINNIISSKELIISKYRKEIITSPDVKLDMSQDDVFLEKLMAEVNVRIKSPNFKMEELAEALHMSYSVLYRKCQAITGLNLVDFVCDLRLKKAVIILIKFGYSISETAFMVGFNDPRYFSKRFKKRFGVNPKLFIIESKKIGVQKYLKAHGLEIME